jgi:hypothetical protein
MAISRTLRWIVQYRLRTLLVAIGALGIGLGWIGDKVRQARLQAAAVEAICAVGGKCAYDFEPEVYSDPQSGFRRGRFAPDAPEWLVDSLGVDYVAIVRGVEMPSAVPDEVISQLASLADLKILKLYHSDIKPRSLSQLAPLKNLSHLLLSGPQIGDEHFRNLPPFPNLELLCLYDTQVTDRGIASLDRFTTLKAIHIDGTLALTNVSLQHFQTMPNLKELQAWNTNFTVGAFIEFGRSMPECWCMPPYLAMQQAGKHFSSSDLASPISQLPGFSNWGTEEKVLRDE